MSEEQVRLKFATSVDRQMFAIEEDLVSFEQLESISESDLQNVCEDMMTLKERREQRRRRKGLIRDHKRSRLMKRLWKTKRKDFMKGIKVFNRSIAGKRMHQKIGRNRKQGKYRHINEWYASISSLLTHLAIQTQYSTTINEEVDAELILESANDILLPVLGQLRELQYTENFDVNEMLDSCEAGLLIDDLLGISEDLDDPEDDDDEEEDDDEDQGDPDDDDPDSGDDQSSGPSTVSSSVDDGGTASDMNPVARAAQLETVGDPLERTIRDLDQRLTDNRTEDQQEEEQNESLVIDPTEAVTMICESFSDGGINYDQFELIGESANDPDVDGEHVIAKIRGPAFFPDTVSRNKVEYSRELWEKTIARPDFLRELQARRIYGTFGHGLVIDDEALRKGEISHIVSDVWIDQKDGIGYAEYLVLNTGPGRMLKTLFGAKSKLRVSTRANGKFLALKNARGNKVPNPDVFFLRGVDFVHDPGYLQAEPSMAA